MPEDASPPTDSERGDRGSAVQRAIALLEMIVAENRPMSLAQMAETLALPKPTVHRLAARLEAEGMLAREPAGANIESVQAQAAAAKAFADANNGTPPAGYFVIGDGPIIGNKQ
jgi:hypothetical protein